MSDSARFKVIEEGKVEKYTCVNCGPNLFFYWIYEDPNDSNRLLCPSCWAQEFILRNVLNRIIL